MPPGVISSAGFEAFTIHCTGFSQFGAYPSIPEGFGGPVSMWAQDSGLGF